MFGFGRKRNTERLQHKETADTFVEATGGGWIDVPETVAADGGSQKDFVHLTLRCARDYAVNNDIAVGGRFTYVIKDIPMGIASPYEIVFGLMMEAQQYDLAVITVTNEEVEFERLQ